jgi:integrase
MGVFKRKINERVEGDTWYIDYRDPAGRRVIKAIGPSKREAEAYLGKIKAAIREQRYFDIKKDAKNTFNELLDTYIEKVQDQKSFKASTRYYISLLREHFGKKLLSEINYKVLEDFRDERKKLPTKNKTPRSDRTVNIELAILRQIFRRGVKWGMLEKNPFENAEDLFYKVISKRERALTEDEIKRLIDACPDYLKPIVITAVYTGLRKSDIFNLKWKDIDLGKGLIRIVESKTGKTRNIVLNSDMRILLQGLPVKSEYVFSHKNGKPFTDLKKSFQAALKRAGIKQSEDRRYKVVFHTLRHTCISLLTERGADTTAVKNYVGHASEEMTKQYTHLSEEYARKTAEVLNGLCGVKLVYGNKVETMANQSPNPSLATA